MYQIYVNTVLHTTVDTIDEVAAAISEILAANPGSIISTIETETSSVSLTMPLAIGHIEDTHIENSGIRDMFAPI